MISYTQEIRTGPCHISYIHVHGNRNGKLMVGVNLIFFYLGILEVITDTCVCVCVCVSNEVSDT